MSPVIIESSKELFEYIRTVLDEKGYVYKRFVEDAPPDPLQCQLTTKIKLYSFRPTWGEDWREFLQFLDWDRLIAEANMDIGLEFFTAW